MAQCRLVHLAFDVKKLLAVGVAMVVGGLFLWQVARPAAGQLTHGFSAYYTASRLVREGASVANFYDDAWFHAQTVRLGFSGAEDIYNLNPPTTALLFWPLAAMPPGEAKAAWTVGNVLLLALVIAQLVRTLGGGAVEVAVGTVLVAGFQPVREDLRLGQVYILLLALETLLFWAYRSRRSVVAGGSLGLALGFKTTGAGLLLLLATHRRWPGVLWTGLVVGVSAVGSLLLLGSASWLRYVTLLSRFGGHPELAVAAYQSLPGLALHLFQPDPSWNPSPLLAAPVLAAVLAIGLALATVALTLRRTGHLSSASGREPALAFAAWAILDVALSPVSEDYHYSLLLLPIAILLAEWRDTRRGWRWLAALIVGIALIGAPLPYKSPALAGGALALLAYPKLYGALGLWGLALVAVEKP